MSISLDIALYLRDNSSSYKKLTLSDRAVLFTLAFRVGSNAYAWISQEELAKELNLTPRGLRKNLTNLINIKLITVMHGKNDKRKNLYHPADFLINYHQSRKINRPICSSISGKNYRNNRSHNSQDIGTYVPILYQDIGTDVPVILCSSTSQDNDYNKEISHKKSPKATYISKETCISKEKRKTYRKERDLFISKNIDLPDWIKKETWKEFLHHRKSVKSPMTELAQNKAINLLKKYKDEGQDIDQIINNSIINGWKGLFPIKLTKENGNGKYNGNNGKQEHFDDLGEMLNLLGLKSIEDIGPLTGPI
ncbi:MAG TPA: helix-turn-helix domain-containing protein [Buchnera sp. (in: enterobacteria)]|nr:helix-turn-helix domain-containing protein [Buchnera sp. (in: enterobacteria)]